MRVVYLAGPYRSKDGINGILENIGAARAVARELWKHGYAVICPHMNTALMDGNDIPDRAFLDGDLELVRRSDILLMLPGWTNSAGALAEWRAAEGRKEVRYVTDLQPLGGLDG